MLLVVYLFSLNMFLCLLLVICFVVIGVVVFVLCWFSVCGYYLFCLLGI